MSNEPPSNVIDLDSHRHGTFRAVLEFDRDDPEFALGWECGMLWNKLAALNATDTIYVETFHAENETMIRRIAAARGFEVHSCVQTAEGWIRCTFTR